MDPPIQSETVEEKEAESHNFVSCDGPLCGDHKRDILGPRYKCVICHNIDFCNVCEADPTNLHDRTHPLIKFESPVRNLHFEMTATSKDGSEMTSFKRPLERRSLESTRLDDMMNHSRSSRQVPTSFEEKMDELRRDCSEDEENLLSRVVDTTHIPPNYSNIFVDDHVIKSLERITNLALKRSAAFSKGILRTNKITGGILYGPPGTGKTLLVSAVAKQTGLNMLPISSGDVFQKEWGEDEKVIRAAFSLARKLHPCIMFIDEADGIFGARKSDDKKHITGMINEFLREWDGFAEDKHLNPIVLLATNRPFDLDPAVLRRAPIHIMMDVPTIEQREGISKVLLEGETLEDMTIKSLARLTNKFTGSDLKSLCVTAVLACVEEQVPDPPNSDNYPETRIIGKRHFETALQTVRATTPNIETAKKLQAFQRRTG